VEVRWGCKLTGRSLTSLTTSMGRLLVRTRETSTEATTIQTPDTIPSREALPKAKASHVSRGTLSSRMP